MKHSPLIIANTHAHGGRALRRLDRVLQFLRDRGSPFDLEVTRDWDQTCNLAREEATRYTTLVAAGGDGTVNAVAHGLLLAGSPDTTLALLPLGTGNDAARAVGIINPDQALDVLLGGSPRFIDVIEVSCHSDNRPVTRFSLVYTAAGFAAEVLRHTTPRVKSLFGPRWCYSVGLLRALWHLRCPSMRLCASNCDLENRLLLVAAGNSQDVGGGRMRLFPGARVNDGQFAVVCVEALGRLQALRRFLRLYHGTHIDLPQVRSFSDTRLEVDSEPPAEIQVDGDICGVTPATFTLRSAALRVLVKGSNGCWDDRFDRG